MNFLKKWLRWQLQYFVSIFICAALIIGFGALSGTFWPNYAWGSTVLFAVVIIWVISRWK